MKQLPEKVRSQLLKLIHARTQSDADVDELNAIFLQVVFALLLIFMCAFFLFISKVGGEISRIDQMKEQIAKAEEAEILRAVEQVTEEYRIRFGLKEFLSIDPATGIKEYHFEDVIKDGKFRRNTPAGKSFAAGAANAAADFADRPSLLRRWEERVLALAGETARRHPKVVKELILANTAKLQKEVIEVETLAVASMQEYLAAHPELVHDRMIRTLLAEINAEKNPENRERLYGELTRQLRNYVYRSLKELCGCDLLNRESL